MTTGLLPALRFARAWRGAATPLSTRELRLPSEDGDPVPATLHLPPERARSGGRWVVLHGLTPHGRTHPGLLRFVRALARAGGPVLVPEIRPWTELAFAPERAEASTRAAVRWLSTAPLKAPPKVHLVGFSFGAPLGLRLAAEPEMADALGSVVAWGGYAHMESTFHFALTGEHAWEGRSYRWRPDPYAGWILGANGVPLVPAWRGHEALGEGLRSIARTSAERQAEADDPELATRIRQVRQGLTGEARDLFDLFVPDAGRPADPAAVREVVRAVSEGLRTNGGPAGIRMIEPLATVPAAEPAGGASPSPGEPLRIHIPVRIYHGGADRLIPFTETLRLEHQLRSGTADLSMRILGPFGHARPDAPPEDGTGGPLDRVRGGAGFLGALAEIFRTARRAGPPGFPG